MPSASLVHSPFAIDYGHAVEQELYALETTIRVYPTIYAHFPARWLAIKLLEQDQEIRLQLTGLAGGPALLAQAQQSYDKLHQQIGEEVDVLIADRRYTWIHTLVGAVVQQPGVDLTVSDKVDGIVTHRLLGVPIFLAVMWVVFKVTADVSAPLVDWIDGVISGPLTHWAVLLLNAGGLGESWLTSLVVDGVIAGVGGVLVFVPVLMALYTSLALLEESGYMARAAFVMDHLMARIGLQGKSFLPMLVGFGCTVPAIYATRTLENEKDRILTALLTPFMSCGARLPVYVLFATVFFPQYAGVVVFSMYLLGIAVAILLGLVLRKTLFNHNEQSALLMELPAYHRPHWGVVWAHTWERTRSFLENAWSLILVMSLILWLLMAIPVGARAGAFAQTNVDQSLFATVAGTLSPLLAPLGFGTWEASGALISGFVAKEVVVSTVAQTYGIAETAGATLPTTVAQDLVAIGRSFGQALLDTVKAVPLIVGIDLSDGADDALASDLRQSIYAGFEASSGGHAALAGLAFMVFVLIYTPCMVAVAAEKQELGAKWMWYSVVGQLVLAWLLALLVFQGGLFLGLG
ncbi:MAG: ferrous iron transport protein B [Caldilineaceae bacterium]